MKSQSLIPIVIAVVGHRNPTDQAIALNKALFKDDLYKLSRMFPDSPIYMLNGLASGMDLVAADIFNKFCLEEKADLDHRLIGVLPKPLNQYQSEIAKEDFNLFEDLISAHHTSVLDPSNCFNLRINDATRSAFEGSVTDEFYVRQSLFLIEHSSILFAFTDGINNGKKGGTSYAVQIAKDETFALPTKCGEFIDDYTPIGIVEYHTERISNEFIPNAYFAPRYWKQREPKISLNEITPSSIKVNFVNRQFNSKLSKLTADSSLTYWEFVDDMATNHKKRYQQGLYLFLILGFATAMTLVRPGWQVIGMTVIAASAYLLPWIQSRCRENFIAFRCLAESLLILEHWTEFGIHRNPADLFRTSLHHDLEWVRSILRSTSIDIMISAVNNDMGFSSCQLHDYQSNVTNQLHWLTSSIRRQCRSNSKLLKIIGLVYLLGCTSSIIFLLASPDTIYKEVFDWVTESWMALLVILIAFRELMGFEEINARYARSVTQIETSLSAIRIANGSSCTNDNERDTAIKHAIQVIGMEKMDELNDWVSDQLRRSYKP